MPISGSCLCGGVAFEIERAIGPFELCHCNRCRKLSGAAALPMIRVETADFRMVSGSSLIKSYEAPVLYRPPAYVSTFCSVCGSPAPPAEPIGEWFEIPAGLLDDDPELMPDKHIFVEFVPPWDSISDDLPQFDVRKLFRHRHERDLPADFQPRRHASPRHVGSAQTR